YGQELYKYDGTSVSLVADIFPGVSNSDIQGFNAVNVNGTLYFTANDGTHGYELWATDALGASAHLVKDIVVGSGSGSVGSLVNINGTLYFSASGGMYTTNGTDVTTTIVS